MTTKGIKMQDDAAMKSMLHRIVATLNSNGDDIRRAAESNARVVILATDRWWPERGVG